MRARIRLSVAIAAVAGFSGAAGAGGTASMLAASPNAPGDRWWSRVTRFLRDSEYRIAPDAGWSGGSAPNRRQGLRATWRDGRLLLAPRAGADEWSLSFAVTEIGRGSHVVPMGPPRCSSREPSLLLWQRAGLFERWSNGPDGIGLELEVAERPEDEPPGPLVVVLDVDGLVVRVVADGSAAWLRSGGTEVLVARDLAVQDASGAVVPARFVASAAVLRLELADRDATYPLTVGLRLASATWTTESDQAGAELGAAVAGAGDVNGDGFSDVVVGAPGFDAGEPDEGRAWVFHGSAAGLATVSAWTFESNQAGARLGEAVGAAGDVNGDGYADVAIGAPFESNAEAEEGHLHVFHGAASGLGATPALTIESEQAGAHLGAVVAAAGDVNGDGFHDLLVAAPDFDGAAADEGRALLHLGAPGGLDPLATWFADGGRAGAGLGTALAGAGDIDGDGFHDIVIGVPRYSNGEADEGQVRVFLGSASGPGTAPDWAIEPDLAGVRMGRAVAGAGDTDGDGHADLLIGSAWGAAGEGRADLHRGTGSGPAPTPVWSQVGEQADADFAAAVATAGDVNGDGYADIVVGAPRHDHDQANEGRAYLFLGGASGTGALPAWTLEADQADAGLGSSVAPAGDVNGDGFSDVIVGARRFDGPEADEGRAWVWHGASTGLAVAANWAVESNQADFHHGWSVASAGDINGDGYSDVLVGAYRYGNGELDEGAAFLYLGGPGGPVTAPDWVAESNQTGAWFGGAVASAGDVNGDGHSDVIVGATRYYNAHVNEGGAFVYHGSPAGLSAAPDWRAFPAALDAAFGSSVASAGDVNGDGYSDVIVGAPGWDVASPDEVGRVYVYHGSATGLGPTPAWSVAGDRFQARLGAAVAGAGDVNADGYSDVIVSAPGYDAGEQYEGRAWVYLGSETGLAAAPVWQAEGNQVSAYFGHSVAGAGDVDGDGYSDILVGAYWFNAPTLHEGAVFLYPGSPSGPSLQPSWRAFGVRAQDFLGQSVASAGDVNGDGYSDIVAGSSSHDAGTQDEGAALVFLGSSTGPGSGPDWIAPGDPLSAQGWSVASAGDVNGDGFADVVVGAPLTSNVERYEGRASIYFGNGAGGRAFRARQARGDGSAPVDLLGAQSGDFRLRASGRAPFGRDRLRLEWAVRLIGSPFEHAVTRTSAWLDSGAPGALGSVVALDQPSPVPAGGPVQWALRIRSAFAPGWASHWMALPGNGLSEWRIRAGALGAVFVYRAPVPAFAPGWRSVALPLGSGNDSVSPPFPETASIPGSALDGIAAAEPLVLYRVLRAGNAGAGNILRAVKGPAGVELSFR